MRIPVNTGSASGSDIFKLVWRGWFFAVLTVFVPLFAVAAIAQLFSEGGESGLEMLLVVILVPVIAAGQALVAGAIGLLGLSIRPPKQEKQGG